MFDRLKSRIYGNKVVGLIEKELLAIHGNERGARCLGMFATAIKGAQEVGDMPTDLLETFRSQGCTVEEGAVAYFDASVTAIKRVTRGAGPIDEIDSAVADMETAIDKMFLKYQTRIVPRNGSAGPAMSEFTKDWST